MTGMRKRIAAHRKMVALWSRGVRSQPEVLAAGAASLLTCETVLENNSFSRHGRQPSKCSTCESQSYLARFSQRYLACASVAAR
jgi:hypothetical protein